jgi:hypothetical protein
MRVAGAAAIAIGIGACTTTQPPTPEPAPTVYQADGTLVVANPRSTLNVDPCTLLTPEETSEIFGPDGFVLSQVEGTCGFLGDGLIDISLDMNPIGQPDPEQVGGVRPSPPTDLFAGNAAQIVSRRCCGCSINIALDPRPATANILIISTKGLRYCDRLPALAERILNRLPPLAP